MAILHSLKVRLRKIAGDFIVVLARLTQNNLTFLGYQQKGVSNYGSNEVTGEKFVIENVLKKYIKSEAPIFFDVGASLGNYSLALKEQFPKAVIYAFEPNPKAFEKIPESVRNKGIKFYNLGMGSKPGESLIYDYKNQSGTEHASVYKGVFTEIHKAAEIEEIKFVNDTLDDFCRKNAIAKIDFLKIDTEGSELDVLKGAKAMLEKNNPEIIQFEFNEMNIVSRVFLKDYYDILHDYNIYRVASGRLIPLPKYKTENEIFKYQNFLAISKAIDSVI